MKFEGCFVPITPEGNACLWLLAGTEERAWENLLKDETHVPYETKENLIERGYVVEDWTQLRVI